MMWNLDPLAREELLAMKWQKRRGYPLGVLLTETPPFRGGTQELCDAGLIEYVSDDGLVTTYAPTEDYVGYMASLT